MLLCQYTMLLCQYTMSSDSYMVYMSQMTMNKDISLVMCTETWKEMTCFRLSACWDTIWWNGTCHKIKWTGIKFVIWNLPFIVDITKRLLRMLKKHNVYCKCGKWCWCMNTPIYALSWWSYFMITSWLLLLAIHSIQAFNLSTF